MIFVWTTRTTKKAQVSPNVPVIILFMTRSCCFTYLRKQLEKNLVDEERVNLTMTKGIVKNIYSIHYLDHEIESWNIYYEKMNVFES